MRVRIVPGTAVGGHVQVPGDKSIAHRWLILSSTARGRSRLAGLPAALDVRSTAACLAGVTEKSRPALQEWLDVHRDRGADEPQGRGFTWNLSDGGNPPGVSTLDLELEGDERRALVEPSGPLDCGNSATTMRLLSGLLAAVPVTATLVGDASLGLRPMERVAEPLREMGASVATTGGHAPVTVRGSDRLEGIEFVPTRPSAQVKSAVLLAGTAAGGRTTVVEAAPTRDHTERALAALGAPVEFAPGRVGVTAFQHEGFEGRVPGDPSSAAFLVAAAALTGAQLEVGAVGLNPTRTGFLEVMGRMGVPIETEVLDRQVGEPVGVIRVGVAGALRGTTVATDELPLVIDEIPVLAALALHARGESWFLGAAELRLKESDRLAAIAEGIRGLGGDAGVEGDDLVVPGHGLRGGAAGSAGDHRIAMALAVAALAADGPAVLDGIEDADVSFPGFLPTLAALGAVVEDGSVGA